MRSRSTTSIRWRRSTSWSSPRAPTCRGTIFPSNASDAEIAGFVRAVGKVARDGEMVVQGYRLLANTGKRSGQEVAHLHVHIFGGEPLGPMLAR